MAKVYVDSIEYVKVQVRATRSGVAYDPTSDTVSFAFILPTEDEDSAVWTEGSWETVNDKDYAVVLRGSDPVLAEGEYSILLKVDADPEVIIRQVGNLIVE